MSTHGGSIVPPTLSEIVFHPRTFTWIWVSNLWILVGVNSTWNSDIQRKGRILSLTSCSLPFPKNASRIKRRNSLISGHQIKVLRHSGYPNRTAACTLYTMAALRCGLAQETFFTVCDNLHPISTWLLKNGHKSIMYQVLWFITVHFAKQLPYLQFCCTSYWNHTFFWRNH